MIDSELILIIFWVVYLRVLLTLIIQNEIIRHNIRTRHNKNRRNGISPQYIWRETPDEKVQPETIGRMEKKRGRGRRGQEESQTVRNNVLHNTVFRADTGIFEANVGNSAESVTTNGSVDKSTTRHIYSLNVKNTTNKEKNTKFIYTVIYTFHPRSRVLWISTRSTYRAVKLPQ